MAIQLRHDVAASHPDQLVDWYLTTVRRGADYFGSHQVRGLRPDHVDFGDLAWAVLLEGRPSSRAAQSLLEFSQSSAADLSDVSDEPLHALNTIEVDAVVRKIVELASLPCIRASVASKTLHPKRRHSIPVIDNSAILGTLANPAWEPGDPRRSISSRNETLIRRGISAVRWAVSNPQSAGDWADLEERYPPFTRIELFDMCWWAILRGSKTGVDIAR